MNKFLKIFKIFVFIYIDTGIAFLAILLVPDEKTINLHEIGLCML